MKQTMKQTGKTNSGSSALVWTALTVAAVAGGCGASFAPPGRGDVGFSASKSYDGDAEVEAMFMRTGGDDDSALGDFAYQVSWRAPLGDTGAAYDISYFGHDVPGDEYGWGLASLAIRQRLGAPTDKVQFVIGSHLSGGVGGRWPGYQEGDRRFPKAIAMGLDLGVRLRADRTPGTSFFVETRLQRSYSDSGREDHRPPTTDWIQSAVGARYDYGPLYGTFAISTATYTNYASDGVHPALFSLSLGYRMAAVGSGN